ncbi:MAG TPA: glycosyltransferase family 1 protein [Euryarchaeota archaeon]|nr:glycosyltransferase family 1 protein [Euryarchaeota archaeon]
MKIAMLTYSMRPRGGVVHAVNLAEALSKCGDEIHLFSLRRSDEADSETGFYRSTAVPTTVIDFDWYPETRERLDSMVDSLVNSLPRDFDIYHAQDCVCDRALQILTGKGEIAPPTVRTVHHIEGFSDRYLNDCEQGALLGDTVKITVSRYWHDILKKEHEQESEVVYNGIDASKFEYRPSMDRKGFILFVGGMEGRKGLEFVIEALEMLHRRGRPLRLVAVAKPGFRRVETIDWFDHLVERCGLGGSVEIMESVDDREIVKLYQDAGIFILPTRMEGWGLAIMEAMAAGCPVITSPVGGINELVKDGENGLLVNVGDVKGIADAAERVLTDDLLRARLIEKGRKTIDRYTWENAAKKTLDIYSGIITARESRN